jgi:hypothetical protein
MELRSPGIKHAWNQKVELIVISLVRRAIILADRTGGTIRRDARWLAAWSRDYFTTIRSSIRTSLANRPSERRMVYSRPRAAAAEEFGELKRPAGVTIIAILSFIGAGVLALGSFLFFFIGIMAMSGGDGGDPVSAAIAGMGVAGGFSLLVLAGVAGCLAVGVLELQEWARIVSIASIAVGIACTIVSIFAFVGYPVIPLVPIILCHLVILATAAWMLEYLARPGVKRVFRAATA